MKKWITTWGCSSACAPRSECNYAKNLTLRYAIPVLNDGEKVRVTLSNFYSNEDCVINSVSVGKADKTGSRKTHDIYALSFNGKDECSIKAGAVATSDELDYVVKKGDILNVSLYIKDITKMATGTPLTG